jgi:hypothetical protein
MAMLHGDTEMTPPPPPEMLVALSFEEMMEVSKRLEQLSFPKKGDTRESEEEDHNEKIGTIGNIPLQTHDELHHSILLDLGYEWPSETRPAKERQNAVVKQLQNYVEVVRARSDGFTTEEFPSILCCGRGVISLSERLRNLEPFVGATERNVDEVVGISPTRLSQRHPVDVVYLSPDSSDFVDTTKGFPHGVVFVVGGIVDRKVRTLRN